MYWKMSVFGMDNEFLFCQRLHQKIIDTITDRAKNRYLGLSIFMVLVYLIYVWNFRGD